jgi:hypothetical protein
MVMITSGDQSILQACAGTEDILSAGREKESSNAGFRVDLGLEE